MTRLPAAQRREQLLDTAAELFARVGYARATTAELAKAAGVTEPIIYRHFNSKKDLFVAIIERAARDTQDHWEEVLEGATDSAHRLKVLVGDNPMVSAVGRLRYQVFLQAITEVSDPDIAHAVSNHISNLHAFLTREVRRAQEDKRVTRVFSAELIAWILIHVGLGYGILSTMGVKGQGEDASGMHVQQMLERLLVGKNVD